MTQFANQLLAMTVAVVVAGLGSSCTGPAPAPTATLPTAATAPRAISLTVAHTNDVSGYLEPCG